MTKNKIILTATLNNTWNRHSGENLLNYLQLFPNNIRVSTGYYNNQPIYYAQTFESINQYEYMTDKSRIDKDEPISLNKPSDSLLFKVDHIENQSEIIEDYKSRLNEIIESNARRSNSSRVEISKYYLNMFEQAVEDEITFATPSTFSYIWQDDETESICFSDIGKLAIENQTALDVSHLNLFEKFFSQKTQNLTPSKRNNTYTFFSNEFHNSNRNVFFLESTEIKAIADMELESKLPMWNLKNLYRGSTSTSYELQEKNIKAFSKGYKIILAKAKMPLLPDQGYLYQDGYFYFYITNIPIASYSKYSKARRFFAKFIKYNKQFDGSYLFNKEEYDQRMRQRFGSNTIYSNLLQKVFEDDIQDLSEIRMSTNIQETTFDPKIFGVYSSVKKAKNNNSYVQYTKVKSKLKEFDAKVQDLTSKSSSIDRTKNRIQQNIERYEAELIEARKKLIETNKTAKEITENLPNYIQAQASLKEKLKEYKEQYNNYLNNFTETSIVEEDSYAKNFKKQGIVIDKVFYTTADSPEPLELRSDHNVILNSLKEENGVKIKKLAFRILKPVVIKVDHAEKGDSCKKVLGGPYLVEVDSSNNLNISLLSSASLFGFDPDSRQIWVHPHTPSIHAGRTNTPEAFFNLILNHPRRACLGEASPAIHAAFQSNDIRQIIIASMTWITNANSSDQWGRNAKHFVSHTELKNESFQITKNFIETQNIEAQMQDKNEVLNLFSDSLQDVEQQLEQEDENLQEEPQEQPLPEINFSLRIPGVENYTPYNSPQEG